MKQNTMKQGTMSQPKVKAARVMDRRAFLAGTAVAGAAVVGASLSGCSTTGEGPGEGATSPASGSASDEREWAMEADVVVVGMGFAGLASAYTAAQEGSSVILLDKAPESEAGGNSRVCLQAIYSPTEVEASIAYFKEMTGDYHGADVSDAVVDAYIMEAANNYDWLSDEAGLELTYISSSEFPNAPSAANANTKNIAISREGMGHSRIWKGVKEAVDGQANITQVYDTPLTDLVYNAEGEVIGIEAESGGQTISIAANKGVVLCCGGFEYDRILQANYLRYPSMANGSPHNTGDGHRVCLRHNIDFWHMNSATTATRVGMGFPLNGQEPKDGTTIEFEVTAGNSYFWVDKYGKRFMNETRDAQHGYGRDALFYNDSELMEWPRAPFWIVLDSQTVVESLVCGWLAIIHGITVSAGYEQEVAAGIVHKADTIEELATKMGLDVDALATTLNEFNAGAAAGAVDEFGREAEKLTALSSPFYGAQLHPVMVNTNGGPRRNENAQIIDLDGNPVPRLYSSGEFGSVWAWYYQGAGNTGECLAFGRIAGRHVSALESWKA